MATPHHIRDEANEIRQGQNRVESIKKYIDDNLSSDLSAVVVSEKFSVSISTLQHSFKKHLLQSYQRYVEKVRMNKAQARIQPGKRIWEIMAATGYKNGSTFYNAFKRIFKHTPATFKNDPGNDP
jgi:AraC-like DNA-binding protein